MSEGPRADEALQHVLGADLVDRLQTCKVLVVGAGGIGCELLKNLALSGFKHLTVVDLDTIEVTNLNRQFLFQKQHVGQSKAVVARESVLRFNPRLDIVAHHADVMGPKFDQRFYEGFDLVLNALDNLKARTHVNRMCLAAERPLVESGSSGYLGQVTVHIKGKYECYECQPKPKAKTFPACTIRNTPSAMIHCIIWAKYLFSHLFGVADSDNDVTPSASDLPAEARDESTATDEAVVKTATRSTRLWAEDTDYDPAKLLTKLFADDVRVLLALDKLWTDRRKPTPLGAEASEVAAAAAVADDVEKLPDQHVWTLEQCKAKFLASVATLRERMKTASSDGLEWDKDDDEAMDFVCAASNLRAYVFHIDAESRFDVKSKAGNIIPAIATTNAVVAGLIVAEAFCILKGEVDACRAVYLSRGLMGGKKLLSSMAMLPPNREEKPSCTLRAPLSTFTAEKLAEAVLKRDLNMANPELSLESGKMILSAPEDEDDEIALRLKIYPRTLASFGMVDGTRCFVSDDRQRFNLQLTLRDCVELPDDVEYVLERGNLASEAARAEAEADAKAKASAAASSAAAAAAVVLDDDDHGASAGTGVTIRSSAAPVTQKAEGVKRGPTSESDDTEGLGSKRSKRM